MSLSLQKVGSAPGAQQEEGFAHHCPHPNRPPTRHPLTLPPDFRAPGSSTSILAGALRGGGAGCRSVLAGRWGAQGAEPQRWGRGPREPSRPWLHPPQTVIPWKFSLPSSDSNKFYAGQHIFSQFPMTGPAGFTALHGKLCCLPPPRPLGP